MTSGAVYGMVKEVIGVGYTVFFERLKKFDEMRLITLTQAKVRGNTREIALRYDADRVVGLWSRKINSIFILFQAITKRY